MAKRITGLAFIIMLILLGLGSAFAQGKKGHDRNDHHHNADNYSWHSGYENHYVHNRHEHQVGHGQNNRRRVEHHIHPWMHAHDRRVTTRYVYFSDYNVYYDYTRNVYITLAGRNWVISTELPLAMRRVDPRRITYVQIDYCGDDLHHYHARRAHYVVGEYWSR